MGKGMGATDLKNSQKRGGSGKIGKLGKIKEKGVKMINTLDF